MEYKCRERSYIIYHPAQLALVQAIQDGKAAWIRAALHADGLDVNDPFANPLAAAINSCDTAAFRLVLSHPRCDIGAIHPHDFIAVMFKDLDVASKDYNIRQETWDFVEFLLLHPDLPLYRTGSADWQSDFTTATEIVNLEKRVGAPPALLMFRWFIASGKRLVGRLISGLVNIEECSFDDLAPEIAQKHAAYARDKWREVHRERKLLGLSPCGAVVLSLVLFVQGDAGYLRIAREQEATPVARFIRLALRLPFELQMVLCNRAYGDSKDHILFADRERALQKLACDLKEQERALAYLKAYVRPPPLFS
jgi:hypothetical protein